MELLPFLCVVPREKAEGVDTVGPGRASPSHLSPSGVVYCVNGGYRCERRLEDTRRDFIPQQTRQQLPTAKVLGLASAKHRRSWAVFG